MPILCGNAGLVPDGRNGRKPPGPGFLNRGEPRTGIEMLPVPPLAPAGPAKYLTSIIGV
jgi:hypothetical protein